MSQIKWKKDEEREALDYFLAEYEITTGNKLTVLHESESPDFLCANAAGKQIGVELVRAMKNPELMSWRRILDKLDYADSLDTWIRAQEAIHRKDERRQAPHWQTPLDTILVVQLVDCPIQEVADHIEDDLVAECAATGFSEIWLADYTKLEAFGTVQLYGLKPEKFRGLHERCYGSWKPYG